jgi:hypothetical protein
MKHFRREHFSTLAGTLVLSAALIGGCDSGTGGGSSSASAQTATKSAKLTGVVMNQTGPVSEGKIDVTDARGQQVASTGLSGTSNKYTLTVPTGVAYPIVLTAKPASGGASVKAVVTGPEAEMMDITTVSTLVVDAAMQLGGLTPQNIARASGGAIGQRMSQGGGGGAGAGGAGGGPGNSSGGVSRGGGHAGHVMPEDKDQKPADASGTSSGMQHPTPSR